MLKSSGLRKNSLRKAFGVKADFEGKCKSITSGMNVDVSVETYKNEKTIILHQKEFASENGKNYAYIVKGNKAKKVEIELGRQNGLAYEVLSQRTDYKIALLSKEMSDIQLQTSFSAFAPTIIGGVGYGFGKLGGLNESSDFFSFGDLSSKNLAVSVRAVVPLFTGGIKTGSGKIELQECDLRIQSCKIRFGLCHGKIMRDVRDFLEV